MKRDLYGLLGVSRKAKARDIEKAYLKIARKVHPDVNPGDPQAAIRFREIKEAYVVLSGARSRALYDSKGEVDPSLRGESPDTEAKSRGGEVRGWEGVLREFLHDDEILEADTAALKGEDLHQVLEITFPESLEGAIREVAWQREVACRGCRGRGYAAGTEFLPCPECSGSGLVSVQRGPYRARRICLRCRGDGEVGARLCTACGGRGRRTATESRKVRIEAGSDTGTTIVVPGGGQPGKRGGAPGDFVLTLRVQPHPLLERKGFNLYGSVPVTVAEAALGATIMVPTAERKAPLNLPAGTQSGQQFRLPERGVPLPGGARRGDLFITVSVVIPAAKDAQARRIFREVEKLFPENPRVKA